MRPWFVILGGLTVWAAHFLAIYVIASALPGQAVARFLVLAASFAAIAADAFILAASSRMTSGDALDRWIVKLGRVGAALSLLAVTWQSVPALLV